MGGLCIFTLSGYLRLNAKFSSINCLTNLVSIFISIKMSNHGGTQTCMSSTRVMGTPESWRTREEAFLLPLPKPSSFFLNHPVYGWEPGGFRSHWTLYNPMSLLCGCNWETKAQRRGRTPSIPWPPLRLQPLCSQTYRLWAQVTWVLSRPRQWGNGTHSAAASPFIATREAVPLEGMIPNGGTLVAPASQLMGWGISLVDVLYDRQQTY